MNPIDRSCPGITQLQAQARLHRVDVLGHRVCWRQFGATGHGPPLVLLHGGHGSWLHWARNIEALASHFSVWVPDLPGYGDSDDLGGGDNGDNGDMARLLDATQTSLDAILGAGTVINVVGFSFGGLVAAQLAGRRQQTGRLALLGPAGHGGPRRPRGPLQNWHRASTAQALQACMRHNLAMHMLFDPAQIDELALQVHTQACQQTRFRSRPISQAGGLSQALASCNAPLLLVWGEHDVTADPTVLAPTLAQGHPQRQAHIVPGVGHWVQYENPSVVNPLLLNWLRER